MSSINNQPQKILKNIEEFLKLEPNDINNGKKMGKEIIHGAKRIEGLILEKKIRKKLDEIISKLKTQYSKLVKDFENSERTTLESDWNKLAKKDLSRFMDEVMLFRDFLIRHKDTIRRKFNQAKYGFDLQDLANTIGKMDIVDEITTSKLFRLLHSMDDRELNSKTKEFQDQLERISELLLILKELEMEERKIGRPEN